MTGDLDIGWLAGIIDGEGNFTIRVRENKEVSRGLGVRIQPQLTIVNTNEKIIRKVERILDDFGIKHGKVRVRRRDKEPCAKEWHKNSKPQYIIEIFGTGLRKLLPMIKDISCKKEEIEIVMKVLEMRYRGKGEWTEEELRKVFKLREKLVKLHGRQAVKLKKFEIEDFV